MKFIAFASLALAARTRHVTAAQLGAKSGQCDDMDDFWGTVDIGGDGCDWYYDNADQCGDWDHDDGNGFYANDDCCACGGGW